MCISLSVWVCACVCVGVFMRKRAYTNATSKNAGFLSLNDLVQMFVGRMVKAE